MTEPILNGYEIARLGREYDTKLKAARTKPELREIITEFERAAKRAGMTAIKRNDAHAWLLIRWRTFHRSGTPGRKATKGRKVPNHD